jgi:hypothetical protein
MHKFQKERRRGSQKSRGCFKCGDITHFIADRPKRKKYDYSNQNDYSNKNDNKNAYKKKNHFGDNNNKKNIKKIMSRACATLSDFNFSNEDLSSSEEDEKVNYKKKEGDFTGLCLLTKGRSSRNNSNFDSDSDVSDDSPTMAFFLKCTNLRMLCVVKTSCFVEFFVRTKILIVSLKTLLLKLLPSS